MRLVLGSLGIAAWLALSAATAVAQAAPRTSSLAFVRLEGAETCASTPALAQAVEARLGRSVFVSAAGAQLSVEGRFEVRAEGGFRAVITLSDGEESLGERVVSSDGATCAELTELVVLAVAVMIDPLTQPAPAEPAPPPPEVVVRTERVVVERPAVPWIVEVDTSLAGALGLLPVPLVGGSLSVLVEPPHFIPILLEGALFPFGQITTAGGSAGLVHVHAGLALCPLSARDATLSAQACIGVDAGAQLITGSGLAARDRERVIGQAHAQVRGSVRLWGPLVAHAGLHMLVPFRHDPFVYDPGGVVFYWPDPVAGMLDLGLGLGFP